MGHCPACGDDVVELVESDTDARYSGDTTVWECPACGAILGVGAIGV